MEFDVVEVGGYYDTWFSFDSDDADPLYSNFGLIGFETKMFLYNIGSMLFILSAFPLAIMTHLVAKALLPCQMFQKIHQSLSGTLMWNMPAVTLLEAYYMLALCTLINTGQQFSSSEEDKRMLSDASSTAEFYSQVFAAFFWLILIVFPCLLFLRLLCLFPNMHKDWVKRHYGGLYLHLNYERCTSLLEPLIFMLRRLFLAGIVVLNRSLLLQVFAFTYLIIAQVAFIEGVKPFESRFFAKQQVFNEVFLMLSLYLMQCLTEFVPEAETRYMIGFVLCGIVGINLASNMGVLVVSSIKNFIWKIKVYRFKRKQKIRLASLHRHRQ